MKVNKIHIAFITISVLTLLLWIAFIRGGLEHNLNLKLSFTKIQPPNAEFLIIGPCEPLWMIDPDKIRQYTGKKTYNLAMAHSDFADNYLTIRHYLRHNKKPEMIILFASPESFDTLFNTFHPYRFIYIDEDQETRQTNKDNSPSYYYWSKIPGLKYFLYNRQIIFPAIQGWKHVITKKNQPYYPNGFEPPKEILWDNHLEGFIALYPKGYCFNWNSNREKYFRKIIEHCQKENIKILLYESPVLKEALPYLPNRTNQTQRIDSLAKHYGIKYVQFRNLPMENSRKNFISTLVTNYENSIIFSDTLARFLKQFTDERP